jgi:hypothetical protein
MKRLPLLCLARSPPQKQVCPDEAAEGREGRTFVRGRAGPKPAKLTDSSGKSGRADVAKPRCLSRAAGQRCPMEQPIDCTCHPLHQSQE